MQKFNPLLCWEAHYTNMEAVLPVEKKSNSKQDPLAKNLWWEKILNKSLV